MGRTRGRRNATGRRAEVNWKKAWAQSVSEVETQIAGRAGQASWPAIRKDLGLAYERMLRAKLEEAGKSTKRGDVKVAALENLEEAVKYLKGRLVEQSRHHEAFEAAGYQNEVRTKRTRLAGEWLRYLAKIIHQGLTYYNLRPSRIVWTVLLTIGIFGLLFWATTGIVPPEGREQPATPVQALYFSAVTLVSLGYGDFSPDPDSLVALVLASVEPYVGYVILYIFVTAVFERSGVHPPVPEPWMNAYKAKLQSYTFH